MKKLLKFLSIALTVALVMSVVAFAENNEATISASKVSANAGETVEIQIEVEDNPGIALAKIKISYDNKVLELVKVEDGGIWGNKVHSENLAPCPYVLFWSNPLIKENIVENGTIATLEFKVAEDAKSGKYPIEISYDYEKLDIIDFNLKKVKFKTEDGEIDVAGLSDDNTSGDEDDSESGSGSGSGSGGSGSGGSGSGSGGSGSGSSCNENSTVNPVKPVVPEKVFVDVKDNDWFKESVDYVVSNGLMNGTSSSKFDPGSNLTRAMLVTVLYRAEGEPSVENSVPFVDVDLDSYYANAVIWAKQNSIVNGVDEDSFAPDRNITREQVATIMYRYAIYKGMDAVTLSENLGFDDADKISEYAVPALNWAVSEKLINGYSNNTVRPANNITRAEMATILKRFLSK